MADDKPSYVAFFGVMGATSAMVFSGEYVVLLLFLFYVLYVFCIMVIMYSVISISALGAAYGTAKSGTGIAAMSVMRPELIMKSIIPVVMAGIIAIYGLVVAVLVGNGSKFSHVLEIRMEDDVILSSLFLFLFYVGNWSEVKFNLCGTYKGILQGEALLFYIFFSHIIE